MADNNKNQFDGPSTPGSGEPNEHPHRFGADNSAGPKKETKRGSFSSSYSPRKEQPRSPEKSDVPRTEPAVASSAPAVPYEVARKTPTDPIFERNRLLLLLAVMIPLGLFAYWNTLCSLVHTWYTNIDYGHGFAVLPLIALFLYLRLDTYPGTTKRLAWIGLVLVALSCLMRWRASIQYLDAVEQWSILFWVLGIVWFFYGTRVFWWSLPSLLFMVFMFPLPFRFEIYLKNTLQAFAAKFAAGLLQLIGEPAVPLANTIRLSTMELEVAHACSGIRFLMSILAIAFAAILLMRRPWWQNVCVIALAVPLALFVNAARIAMTGILLQHHSELVRRFAPNASNLSVVADEFSGLVMIFVAVGLFFAFLWYLGKVFREVEIR